MMEWYLKVLRQYADFSGRARRKEYWMFTLISFVISIALELIALAIHFGWFNTLYSLAVLVPSLAVGARRLHDTNRSGWWQLLWLIPVIGWIVLIVWLATEGDRQPNAHGPDPKAVLESAPVPS